MTGKFPGVPPNGWITNAKDVEDQAEMSMTHEERERFRRSAKQLHEYGIRVSQMPYQKEDNSFWIDAEGRGLSFFEEGGQYKVVEVKTEGKDQSFNLKVKLEKIN